MDAFKFDNNFAWAGINIILYNVWIDNLYTGPSDNLAKKINFTDIGFEYKATSSSNWEIISISGMDSDWTVPIDSKSTSTISFDNIDLCGIINTTNRLHPYLVAIKMLTPNKSYDIRSYYKVGNTVTYYNAQTITTLTDENQNIDWVKGTGWDDYDEITQAEYSDCFDFIVNLVNSFCNYKQTVTFNIGSPVSGVAAQTSGYEITAAPKYANYKGILLHELGHIVTQRWTTDDDIIKFMEWASHIPYAKWRWQDGHCYPMLSPSQSYRENLAAYYRVAAAFQVSLLS